MIPFFYFSRKEQRGILLLLFLVIVVLIVELYVPKSSTEEEERRTPEEEEAFQTEYDAFTASLRQQEEERTRREENRAGGVRPLTPFPFNPNRADSATLCHLGLPSWMARNVIRYREAGGKFRRPDDFRRIYGLTEEQFLTLRPYITLTPEDTLRSSFKEASSARQASSHRDSAVSVPRILLHPDSIYTPREKYPPGTLVDLNRADTTELMKIPGIGSTISRLIVSYRQRLGGFYDIGQLQEINLDAEQLRPWFRIDEQAIRRIDLTTAGIETLRRHPYINFYQARAMVEHRRKHGPLSSLKPLALLEEFTAQDLERIGHYVTF
ncbi:MAG: helix-hairpin-helix domain-containing protein [Bacteroides sp.]|nr:helix-hairpin-helix domain-containing protein [Bacteroides sp.]